MMFKQIIWLVVAALLINPAFAGTISAADKENRRAAEKVKAGILKLGTGTQTRIKVKLRDKTKIEGYLSAAADEHFTVTNPKTGLVATIQYGQVKTVKGNNLSTGAKIAIGVGIAAAVIFAIWFYTVVYDD